MGSRGDGEMMGGELMKHRGFLFLVYLILP